MADSSSSAGPSPVASRGSPLPHVYWLIFTIIEPMLTFIGGGLAISDPATFYHDLVPAPGTQPLPLTHRGRIIVWQLGNCYWLLGFLSLFVYHTIPKAVPKDLAAQEKLFKAFLTALAICDITHVGFSLAGLPIDILQDISKFNAVTHGNTTMTAALFFIRLAWLSGLGRASYVTKNDAVKSE